MKRGLLIWSLLIMPLVFSLGCGNNPNNTATSFTQVSPDTNPTPETSTIPEATDELDFEKLSVPLIMAEPDVPPQLHLMTSNNSTVPDVIDEIPPEGQLILDGIDYSNDFVLFVFMGKQDFSDVAHGITRISQIDNTIHIEANFPKTGKTVIPGFTYANYVLRVSKKNMTRFGEITFILLDQDGNERARAVYDISQ